MATALSPETLFSFASNEHGIKDAEPVFAVYDGSTAEVVVSDMDPTSITVKSLDPKHPEPDHFDVFCLGSLADKRRFANRYGVNTAGTDTEVVATAIESHTKYGVDFMKALRKVMPHTDGTVSVIATNGRSLHLATDRYHERSFYVGDVANGSFAVTAARKALEVLELPAISEVQSGSTVQIDQSGIRAAYWAPLTIR